jgi:cytochrome c peroxidase
VKKHSALACTLSGIFFAILILASCEREQLPNAEPQGAPVLPAQAYDYASKHDVNSDYATLGRVLFYDKQLSVNNTTACGSCHMQKSAFATNNRFDRGFDGQLLTRNSPSIQGFRGFEAEPIQDPTFPPKNGVPTADNQKNVLLFWDGRQSNLADMVLNPVLNHKEMSMPDFDALTKKLGSIPYYQDLFTKAYGTSEATKEKIALALEAFICCLNTKSAANKPEEKPIPTLADVKTQEDMGKFLFHNKYNCAECHDQKPTNGGPAEPYGNPSPDDPGITPMFNIGLDEVAVDKGLGRLTGLPGDIGMFKVPTLQNISATAPYMHDGRFANLNDVLDHYSHGIKQNPNLSSKFRNVDGTAKKLNISAAEKSAIIAFLNTLRDDDFLTSPMYSDPFKQ